MAVLGGAVYMTNSHVTDNRAPVRGAGLQVQCTPGVCLEGFATCTGAGVFVINSTIDANRVEIVSASATAGAVEGGG